MQCPHCKQEAPATNYKCPHCGKVLSEAVDFLHSRRSVSKPKTLRLSHLIAVLVVIGLAVVGYLILDQINLTPPTPKEMEQNGEQVSSLPEGPQQDQPPASASQSPASQTTEDNTQFPDTAVESWESQNQPEAGTEDTPATASAPRQTSHNPGERVDISRMTFPGKTTVIDFYSEYCGPCRTISPKLQELAVRRDDIEVVKIDINRPGVRGIDWNSPVARQYNLRSIPHFVIFDKSGSRTLEGTPAYQRISQWFRDEGIQ